MTKLDELRTLRERRYTRRAAPKVSSKPKAPKKPIRSPSTVKAEPRAKGGAVVAPPGECRFCDMRRARAAESMRRRRAEGKA